MRVDFQTGFPLCGALRYDPFLRIAVGDVVLRAEVVEEVAAADAEAGFERGRGIIEPCVDYLVGEMLLVCLVCGVCCQMLGVGLSHSMHTSELRLLVSVPGASWRSSRMVEVPSRAASCRAVARPTTPAPIIFHSD